MRSHEILSAIYNHIRIELDPENMDITSKQLIFTKAKYYFAQSGE